MVTKSELKEITSLYHMICGRAEYKIHECRKSDEQKGFKKSQLTSYFEKTLEKATEDIKPLKTVDEHGISRLATDEDGHIIYDKKDTLKMLKAIRIITTHILD